MTLYSMLCSQPPLTGAAPSRLPQQLISETRTLLPHKPRPCMFAFVSVPHLAEIYAVGSMWQYSSHMVLSALSGLISLRDYKISTSSSISGECLHSRIEGSIMLLYILPLFQIPSVDCVGFSTSEKPNTD